MRKIFTSPVRILITFLMVTNYYAAGQGINKFTSSKGARSSTPASNQTQSNFKVQRVTGIPGKQGMIAKPVPFVKPAPNQAPSTFTRSTQPNSSRQKEIIKAPDSNLPVMIKGKSHSVSPLRKTANTVDSRELYQYLDEVKGDMQIVHPSEEFVIRNVQTDDLQSTHIKMQQKYKGLDVYGGEIILHATGNILDMMNGRYYPTPELSDITPAVPAATAITTALNDLRLHTHVSELSATQKEMLHYRQPVSKLEIYHKERNINSEKLVWHLTVRPNFIERWEYFIDAKTGAVIDQYNNTCADGPATANAVDLKGVSQTIHTYQVNANYYMLDGSRAMFNASQGSLPDNPVGAIWTIDAQNSPSNNISVTQITSSNNSWNNPTAVSAHNNAALAYLYFLNTHSRNAISGDGETILSVINVADEGGGGMDNAFWNGQFMCYGNGNQAFSSPLAKALDVAGHEMTHGVTEKSAGLVYQNQSGAINESMSDVFGVCIERVNFKLGEDVVNPGVFPSGALRDLSNPHNGGSSSADNGWQPAHMNEFVNTQGDNGGVHINSGIPNKAFYLFQQDVTLSKAELVYYRALTSYLTSSSQFIDLRLAVVQAASDLYGSSSAEVTAAKNAFDDVGILDGTGGGNSPHDLSVSPGGSFILVMDAPETGANDPKLWATDSVVSGFLPLTTTSLKSKPSVPDDGTVAYYVAKDGTVKMLTLDSNPTETQIDPSTGWHNVAVSKNGKRLALNREVPDSSIYIVDIASGNMVKYVLFNPTTAQGEANYNVLFSDALEWDYSSQYVMYDALSIVNNTSGTDLSYWDIGVLNGWDNQNTQAGTFGDGGIQKLFSNLPEGVSIGNATFSKISPNIIAFDVYDVSTGTEQFAVSGANLETGATGSIFLNNTLGYPNYSRTDDKVVFTSLQAGDTIIGIIDINADKISSSAQASIFVTVAKEPVWIVQGRRSLISVPEEQALNSSFTIYPNPANEKIVINYKSDMISDVELKIYNFSGQEVKSLQLGKSIGENKTEISVADLVPGMYFVRMFANGEVSAKSMMKLGD